MNALDQLNKEAERAVIRQKHKRNRLFIEAALSQMATDFGAKETAKVTREMLEQLEG